MRSCLLPFLACVMFLCASIGASAQFSKVDFDRLTPIAGVWRMPQDKGWLYEIWTRTNDTLFAGYSFLVNGRDTIPEEKTKFIWSAGRISFLPTVARQNRGKQVSFELRSITDTGFVFENPAHDFPQRVLYNPHSDSLYAFISGKTGKGYRHIRFQYTKVR